jgi:hypothetical protein
VSWSALIPGAATSLREGLAETLTAPYGRAAHLGSHVALHERVESMIEICRHTCRWCCDWCAVGMIEAGKQFLWSTAISICGRCEPALEHVAVENVTANEHNHASSAT